VILARCPHCATTFRAAPEALKLRAGKVRCGKCHGVFNALDHVVTDAAPATPFNAAFSAPPANVVAVAPFALVPPPSAFTDQAPAETTAPASPAIDDADDELELTEEHFADTGQHRIEVSRYDATASAGTSDNTGTAADKGNENNAADDAGTDSTTEPLPLPAEHDPLFEAQAAGLVAARDTRDAPGYSKWAEGTLSAPSIHFDEPHKSGWLSVLLLVTLALMLLVQAVHFWRQEIANRWPESRPWLEEACLSLDCTVPYPRDLGQINLEASELQIDPERGGLLVLSMTLKNRAPFVQEFPSVELTLTDARDNVVIRRVLAPHEWLPSLPDASGTPTPAAFPANKEIAARLWIDSADTGAVGYRLYLLYP